MNNNLKRSIKAAAIAGPLLVAPGLAHAFAYVFAGETLGTDIVAHSMGYTGTGGTLDISIGILAGTTHATDMEISVMNSIQRWNTLDYMTDNVYMNAISGAQADFESTLMHEMGHALGLGHVNLASESGLSGSDRRYSVTTNGVDNAYNLDPGSDGIIGTDDDVRGDDVNMFWYETSNNNPFDLLPGVVDSTTFGIDVGGAGEPDWVNTSSREVANSLGYGTNTESLMTQGAYFGEIQRDLTADDVAGIMYAMTGMDEIAGTVDDYVLDINYAGIVADGGADILISLDNTVSFAAAMFSGTIYGNQHAVLTDPSIHFNESTNWYFNDQLLETVPTPSTAFLFAGGLFALGRRRRQTQGCR